MTEKLSTLLPRVEPAPQMQELKLPKLTKINNKPQKISLPKLKKIEA